MKHREKQANGTSNTTVQGSALSNLPAFILAQAKQLLPLGEGIYFPSCKPVGEARTNISKSVLKLLEINKKKMLYPSMVVL